MARRSAVKARTQAGNQIRDLIISAPQQLREQLDQLSLDAQVERCAMWRPGPAGELVQATKRSLRHLARRHQALSAEIAELDHDIADLCAEANPALLAVNGVGPEAASVLLTPSAASSTTSPAAPAPPRSAKIEPSPQAVLDPHPAIPTAPHAYSSIPRTTDKLLTTHRTSFEVDSTSLVSAPGTVPRTVFSA